MCQQYCLCCIPEGGAELFSSGDEGDGAMDDDFGGDLGELSSGGDSDLDGEMGGSDSDGDSLSEGGEGEGDDSDAETKVERQSRKLDKLKCAIYPGRIPWTSDRSCLEVECQVRSTELNESSCIRYCCLNSKASIVKAAPLNTGG